MPFQSKRQSRACFALARAGRNGTWDCKEWAGHTNYKILRERKKKAASVQDVRALVGPEAFDKAAGAPLDKQAAYRAGLLSRLVAGGAITAEQLLAAAEAELARVKRADFASAVGSMVNAGSKLLGGYGEGLGTVAIGAPALIGGGIGLGLGHLRNAADESDADALRYESILRRYQQMAEAIRQRKALHPDVVPLTS